MSIADEIRKLEELRKSGALTDEEFAQAKARFLDSTEGRDGSLSAPVSQHLEEIRHQNELAQIDREWEIEREQYLVYDRWGRTHVPQSHNLKALKLARGMAGGVRAGVVIFGLAWVVIVFFITRNAPFPFVKYVFPLFGILFVIFGIRAGSSMSSLMDHAQGVYEDKAGKYEQAYERYRRRRSEAMHRDR